MKYFRIILLTAIFGGLGVFNLAAFSGDAHAATTPTPESLICQGSGGTTDAKGVCNVSGNTHTVGGVLRQVTNVLIFVVGGVAVLMSIIGGLRYVLSGGDSKATGDAKNTILYSVVGIVVAFSAYAIVNFVLARFK